MRRFDRAALRRACTLAALVLALTSRGDAIVLAAALALIEVAPVTLVAILTALAASSWRWGATSLDALAGAQSVLGPAGWTGSVTAALGSWLAALALLLALSTSRSPLRLAALGATVAAVLAGAGSGSGLAVRAGVALVAAALALGIDAVTAHRPRLDQAAAALSAALGLGALVAVAPDAPRWPPTVDLGLVGQGLAIAGAAGALGLVGSALWAGARWSDAWVRPRLRPARAPRPGAPSRPR